MRRFSGLRRSAGISIAIAVWSSAGCSLRESVIDGAYGGVSDTVASVISETLLGLLGIGT